MEAQGEIRGGRFVSGFVGEQFARPEAVELLREIRRDQNAGDAPHVAAADPLNLAGIITPGPRISPLSGLVVPLWQDAEPDMIVNRLPSTVYGENVHPQCHTIKLHKTVGVKVGPCRSAAVRRSPCSR